MNVSQNSVVRSWFIVYAFGADYYPTSLQLGDSLHLSLRVVKKQNRISRFFVTRRSNFNLVKCADLENLTFFEKFCNKGKRYITTMKNKYVDV